MNKPEDEIDKLSIEELCKPLSAKVMPRTAMHNIGGREMSESRALSSQRSAVVQNTRKLRKRKKKDEQEDQM